MNLLIAAVGQRMPAWVDDAWKDHARRFPPNLPFELTEIRTPPRTRNGEVADAREAERVALIASAPAGALRVALDGRGTTWTTGKLAARLEDRMQEGRDVAFMIGGPDGRSPVCREQAELLWSFGGAAFPHALVRVIVAEQVYRAWSITQNHPHHRA